MFIVFLFFKNLCCACYLLSGSFNGGLSGLSAHEMGAAAVREALIRAQVAPGDVSEVILGQVLTAGL